MKTQQRQKAILNLLLSESGPISGATLSKQFGVSRQIIVRDIAVLKGIGHKILSTHNGYMVQNTTLKERVFKLYHTTQQTEEELRLIINLGGTVVDVFVWHKVYGKLTAKLNIFSELQIKQFIEGVRTGKSIELMNVTGGFHYHTVRAESEETLNQIETTLKNKGFIAPEI